MRLGPVLVALAVLSGCGSVADDLASSASSATTQVASTTTTTSPTSKPPTTAASTTASTTAATSTTASTTAVTSTTASTATTAPASTSDTAVTTTAVANTTVTTTAVNNTVATTTAVESSGSAEVDALIDELSSFVEDERGLEFQRRPQIELLDEDEFSRAWVQLISADAAENAEAFQHFTNIYRTMGIISADDTLEDIWTRFGDAGVLGYYETETEQIVLRSGEITVLTKTTLVHELVHALEDQAFNLDRPSYDDRTDEVAWAFSSVVEGSARVIENRYRATLTQEELAEERAAIANLPRAVSLSEFNPSFLELQFGRYNYGEVFAEALWAQGQAAVDRALLSPPSASELILDPASYLAGAQADESPAPPPADAAVFEQGAWGEAAWIALLSDVVSASEARQIADGWGGDWYVAWVNAGSTCVRIDVAADSPAEFDQYAAGLTQWVNAQSGRDLTEPEPGLIRLTACS